MWDDFWSFVVDIPDSAGDVIHARADRKAEKEVAAAATPEEQEPNLDGTAE